MRIGDWMPTTTQKDDSFNPEEVNQLKTNMPVVYTYVPPLFEGKISGSTGKDVLPIDDSHLRAEGQDDTEYWLGYRE